MIDNFLADLFAPEPQSDPAGRFGALRAGDPAESPPDPLSRDRFLGVPDSLPFAGARPPDDFNLFDEPPDDVASRATMTRLAGPMPSGGVPGDSFADRFGGGPRQPMAGPAPGGMPMVNPPLPQPRPDIEGILNGDRGAAPPGAAPASGGAPGNIMARLLGNRSGSEMAPLTDGAGGRDRGTGPDARIKRVLSALAGGMAGGNPAFKGGAFMKGMSGGLTGGLKSDKEEREAEAAADDKTQKQGNFDRTQLDKEKTSEALRKLYGERGAALLDGGGKGGKGAAWNKPPHERLKDAEKLIIDKQKSLYGQINPLAPKAERQAAQERADKELEGFKKKIYKGYGIDPDGNETSPSMPAGGGGKVPSATPSKGSGGMRGGGSYDDPHVPTTQEEFDKVPPGGYFINPADGEIMRKKGQKTSALDDTPDTADEQQDAA